MHEFSLVYDLCRQLLEIADHEQAGSIESATIEVGPLSNVVPDLLGVAFDAVRATDDRLKVCHLNIRRVPLTLSCRACSRTVHVEGLEWKCRLCGSSDVTTTGGDDILLRDVEVLCER